MSTGHIRDFTQPNPEGQKPQEPIKRNSLVTGVEVTDSEVKIQEGTGAKIRRPVHRPGEPDITLHSPQSWEEVKTDEDIK